jgi:hypothetical protein
MIFDDLNQPVREPAPAEQTRRRRRRRRSSSSGSSSSFREAVKLAEPRRERSDGNTVAWLWVLGLLVAAALGFAWYLHHERSAPTKLSGDAPSTMIMPFIDPILAPLETGLDGYSSETLSSVEASLRAERAKANLDNQDVYSAAATMVQILGEADADRRRHIDRLLKLGSPVLGMPADPAARTDIGEAERKHLELAVGVSWQRNSVTYRNRIEELWYRLLRLEQGRFRDGSAPQSMMPEIPSSLEGGVSPPASIETEEP